MRVSRIKCRIFARGTPTCALFQADHIKACSLFIPVVATSTVPFLSFEAMSTDLMCSTDKTG